jgi:hypothetical protein
MIPNISTKLVAPSLLPLLVLATSLTSASAMAADYSPLSPAFVLKQSQLLWDTGLQYAEGRSSSYATFSVPLGPLGSSFRNPVLSRSSATSIAQSLQIGLPWDSSIGLGDAYVSTRRYDFGTVHVFNEFLSPTVFAKKTWGADANRRLQLAVSATPKTRISGLPTPARYSFGVTGIYIAPEGLTSSVGLSRDIYKRSSFYDSSSLSDSTEVSGRVTKDFGQYLVDFTLAARRSNEKTIVVNDINVPISISMRFAPAYDYSASASVSRKVSDAAWISLGYRYSRINADGTSTSGAGSISNDVTATQNSLTLLVRALF